MKIKSFVWGFLLWLFSVFLFIIFLPQQKLSSNTVDFQNIVNDKINGLRSTINSLWGLNQNIDNIDKLEKFNEIKEVLDTQYFDTSLISESKMWDLALQSYVRALWDPFTVYLTAKDNETLHKELKWTSDFEWIWAVVTKVPQWVMIEQLIKWWPAQKVWLKPLDIILQASWVDLSKLPLWDAVNKIKWPAWTEVELTIKRQDQVFKIKVKREKILLKSVNSDIYDYKWYKIWYINISSVGEDTYNEFEKQLDELLSKKISWLILDLRWNWWWYLEIGYKIWEEWAKKWDIIVQTKYRDWFYNQVLKAKRTWKLHWFPTIILIDSYTASAWEIITAAIKENNENMVKLVWTKTFGKWTIQTLQEFKDGSSLKYTIWKWFTPKWENVCKEWVLPWEWINPDIEIKFDPKLYKEKLIDTQLEKGKELIIELISK
jgi:carboxyl-terminal processing protease